MKREQLVGSILMFVLGPLITIVTFNHFFAAGIPLTFESWILTFLVGVLAALILVGLVFLSLIGFVFLKGVPGFIVIGAAILSLPVVFILAFNLIMRANVPITVESYFIVGLVLLGEVILSGVLKRKVKFL